MDKSITQVTLYDLMAEDSTVWVNKNPEFGYCLQIDLDGQEGTFFEKCIHPYAMETFATFCRGFLRFYEQSQQELAA